MGEITYKNFCNKSISNIGYGCATLANIYKPLTINKCKEIIEYNFNEGINYFDVAPFYGGELAEKNLGISIKDISRSELFIATKIGRYTDDNSNSGAGGYFDFSPSKIEQSIKNSMNNMNIKYIDLLQCHDIENVSTQTVLDALPIIEHFKTIGIINGIGINSYPIQPLINIIENTTIKINSVGTYAHNTLINNSVVDYIDYFTKKNISIINSSPLAMGLLTQKGPPDWHPASDLMLNTVNDLNTYCISKQLNISNLSMIYSLSNKDILTTISGGNSITEIKQNLNCLNKTIDDLILKDINKIIYPIKNKLWGPEEGINPVYTWEY
jgi:aryl-alcohol dehydrogenase-like predicted oxidoreductase